uniref:Uncharacterized protein n=1 Tax=Pavo cristatus TaxID=9049 RepID=A0A8C9FIL4_PAVCR
RQYQSSGCLPQPSPLSFEVELTIACTNLLDKDVGSKSDPLCVLLQNTSGQQWYEVRCDGSHDSVRNIV